MTMIKKSHQPDNLENIPADNRLPGLPHLFGHMQVIRALVSNLKNTTMELAEFRSVYVRYKPATNCIVAYIAKFVDGVSGKTFDTWLYGKCFTPEGYAVAIVKANAHRGDESAFLNPIISAPDDYVIFYVFPYDCEIKELPTVCDSRKISRILHDIDDFFSRSAWRISDKRLKIEVVRYKPEKRAVVKIESRAVNRTDHKKKTLTVYLRTYCDDRGKVIYDTMRELHRTLYSHPEVKVPRALGYIDEKRFLLTEGLAGNPLVELLKFPLRRDAFIKTAGALAVLHQITDVSIAERNSKDLMDDARATGETLKQIVPEIADSVRAILNQLEPLHDKAARGSAGFVHGDFHCGQILIEKNSTVILDFDRSFWGETLFDVGNFCAHLHIIGRQNRWDDTQEMIDTFVAHYEKAIHKKLDKKRLKLWTAYGLFLFSVSPFRSMEPDWKSSVIATVQECKRILS